MSVNLRMLMGVIVGTFLFPQACSVRHAGQPEPAAATAGCTVLADARLEEPLLTIAQEYLQRTQAEITIRFLPEAELTPLVEKTVRKAGLQDRVSFVLGDAQKLPFDDDSAPTCWRPDSSTTAASGSKSARA